MAEVLTYLPNPTWVFPSKDKPPFILAEILSETVNGIKIGGTENLQQKGIVIPLQTQELFTKVLGHSDMVALSAAYDLKAEYPSDMDSELAEIFRKIRRQLFARKRIVIGSYFLNHHDDHIDKQAREFVALGRRVVQEDEAALGKSAENVLVTRIRKVIEETKVSIAVEQEVAVVK